MSPAYISIEGKTQGNITQGAFTADPGVREAQGELIEGEETGKWNKGRTNTGNVKGIDHGANGCAFQF